MPARLSHESLQQLLYTLVLNALKLPINILPVFVAERASNSHIDHLYTQPCRKILFVRIKTLSFSYKTWIIPSIFYRVWPAYSSSPMKFDIIRHHSVILQFHKLGWPTRHHLGKFASNGVDRTSMPNNFGAIRSLTLATAWCIEMPSNNISRNGANKIVKGSFLKGEVVSRLLLHLCFTILSLLVLDTSPNQEIWRVC